LEPLLRKPAASGLFADFDGTLSEIVDEPDAARPVDGAVAALEALSDRLGRVAVISGRPVSFLERFFDADLLLTGLYGLEQTYRGQRTDHPQGGSWREVVDDVTAMARARGPEGMRVEPKGLSLTLHYRGRPEVEPDVRAFAETLAVRSGLECRPARMSFELHPPIPLNKGTAVLGLAEGLDAVAFLGDDVGDIKAFDALDELASRGVSVLRVAVGSSESVPDLIDRADLVVDGPPGALAFVQSLYDRLA
jgi:trehalose 6-phosphate phosphatase